MQLARQTKQARPIDLLQCRRAESMTRGAAATCEPGSRDSYVNDGAT